MMMATTTELSCTCGATRLKLRREPILAAECHCNSCREAGARLSALPGAKSVFAANGGTPFVLYRKDRAEITHGAEHLKALRLKPESSTRRVVATCCNTPLFLEFKGGHWISIYANLWPESTRPAMDLRTMTSDLPDRSILDDRVPGSSRQSFLFFAKLLGAWIAMGFRSPKVEVNGELQA